MPKSGEDVLVAVFNTPESAIKVCMCVYDFKGITDFEKRDQPVCIKCWMVPIPRLFLELCVFH